MIPISVPHLAGNEWQYVKECLDTEWVSSVGKYVDKFEDDICKFTGARYAVACVNGTAAIHVALLVADVKCNDEVIVPTVTFIASVNAARYVGADPIFMDCDSFYNIDVAKTVEFIEKETIFRNGDTFNKLTNKRISAIIPVHVYGNAVEMEKLIAVCRMRNIKIVEDAAESIGTYYLGGELENHYTGTIGDIGCFSFNGNKIITTGGGGMIVTHNDKYAKQAKYFTTQAKDDDIRYIHHEIGYNYRLTNIQAALGVAQLEKLPEFINIKKRNYQFYKEEIDKISGLRLADTPPYASSNYWYYCLQIDKEKYGKDREQLMAYLAEHKIQTRPIWQLNHLQRPYTNCQSYKIEKAYEMLEKTLNIPCSVNLTDEQIRGILHILRRGRE